MGTTNTTGHDGGKTAAADGLELKWWEKKKGMTLDDKRRKRQGKLDRKARRERERNGRQGKQDPEAALEDDDGTAALSAQTAARRDRNNGHRPGRRPGPRPGYKPDSRDAGSPRNSKAGTPRRSSGNSSGSSSFTRKGAYSGTRSRRQDEALLAALKGSLFARSSLDESAVSVIEDFEAIVNSVYPLTSRQRALLPAQIRSLSHELTDEREERRMGYMNETTALSAYIHYYLWWNIVRLTRVFANLPESFFNLTDGSVCLDIGSGPLTVPIALFLSRPDLRSKKLTFYCMDLSAQALQAGENLFLAVAARMQCEAWNIIRVCGSLGDMQIKQKADFVCSANLFNELMQMQESDRGQPPDFLAKKYSTELLKYIEKKNDSARIFISEPGVPSCGRLISCMRDAFMRRHFYPAAPCPHCGTCPMEGKRGGKWCNYAFSTEDAPQSLRRFSRSIYIPKERAVLSFLALEKKWDEAEEALLQQDGEAGSGNGRAGTGNTDTDRNSSSRLTFRISSDPIRLPGNRTGYYACSSLGLLLVVTDSELHSGDLLEVEADRLPDRRDEKTGALMLTVS